MRQRHQSAARALLPAVHLGSRSKERKLICNTNRLSRESGIQSRRGAKYSPRLLSIWKSKDERGGSTPTIVSQSHFEEWRIHVQTFAWFSLSIGKTLMIVWFWSFLIRGSFQSDFLETDQLTTCSPSQPCFPFTSRYFLSNKDGRQCGRYRNYGYLPYFD